jgi:hypothetical protein
MVRRVENKRSGMRVASPCSRHCSPSRWSDQGVEQNQVRGETPSLLPAVTRAAGLHLVSFMLQHSLHKVEDLLLLSDQEDVFAHQTTCSPCLARVWQHVTCA